MTSLCRRQVLAGAGVIAGAGLLAACSDSGGSQLEPGEVLTPVADVPVGGSIVVTPEGGQPIVISRPDADRVVALSAICTHQGCEVAPVEDSPQVLHCPCHRSEFETFTGEVLEGPATKPLPEIPVEISGDNVVSA